MSKRSIGLSIVICLLMGIFLTQPILGQEKVRVVIWGLNDIVPGGEREMVREFNRTHDHIELVAQMQVQGSNVSVKSDAP